MDGGQYGEGGNSSSSQRATRTQMSQISNDRVTGQEKGFNSSSVTSQAFATQRKKGRPKKFINTSAFKTNKKATTATAKIQAIAKEHNVTSQVSAKDRIITEKNVSTYTTENTGNSTPMEIISEPVQAQRATIETPQNTTNSNKTTTNRDNLTSTSATNENIANINKQSADSKSNRFDSKDEGPYSIYIESRDKNIGKLHPMAIGKLFYGAKSTSNNAITEIKANGRNRIKITFKTGEAANKLLDSNFLSNNQLTGYIPYNSIVRYGIIKHVDTKLTETELINNIYSQSKILAVKRINRKIIENNTAQYVPTQTIIVTFRGQILPNYVTIHYVRCSVEPYIQRVVQCYNCLRFGHIGKQCRSTVRCCNCGNNHSEHQCPPSTPPQCVNCDKDHKSNDKKCNVYLAQVEIKRLMSYKNISYYEAQSEVKGRAYAEVSTTNFNNNKEFPALVQEDENLPTPTQTFTQINTYNKNMSQMQTKKSQNNTRQHETRNTFPIEDRNFTFTYPHSNTPNPHAPQHHRIPNQIQTNTGTGYIIQIIQLIDILLEKTQQTSEKQITHELEQIKNQISALQQTTTI